MQQGYWAKALEQRIQRRRALAVTATGAVGTALLAACGGDDGGRGTVSSGLVSDPVDTTKEAPKRGVLKDRTFQDPPSLDIFTANNPLNVVCTHCYSTLVQFQPGYLKASEREVIGDLVESFEWSPDGLQVVMKLQQGVKLHDKPPINGRAFDVDDVLFSWDRFTRKSSARAAVANAVDSKAPIISLTATDPRTVVLKLKEPLVYALGLFASSASGGILMLPKETDSSFDIRNDMIGTGPFMMTNYTPSVGFTMKRHPEYYEKPWPLVDQVDLPIITEYSAALSQLKAGNIYSMGGRPNTPGVTPEDILPVKRETPQLLVYQGDMDEQRTFGSRLMSFGWLPEGRSPFLDERVRQAISMSWDRDLYQDVVFNVSSFESEGLPVEVRWNTHLAGTHEGWWLDPKSKDFGSNAKYFQHDLPEAKKLLTAAGYPNGFETISNYVTGGQLPTAKHAEIIDGFITELGIPSKVYSVDYATEYIPRYRDGKGQYEGWAYMSTAGGATGGDPVGALANQFWSKGGTASFHGFSTSGRNDLSGDPQVDALIEKARVERDTERRRALVFDIQRYLAKPMYSLLSPGVGTGFTVAWPCLSNYRVYRGGELNNKYLWVDETKPPLKSG